MTRSISRRSFLAAVSTGSLARAASWELKAFPQWTAEDVDRLLTDSPWAKPATVPFELEPPPTRLLSDFSDIGLPGGVGWPGGGWPGGGRGVPTGPGSGSGQGGGWKVRTEAYLTVRWSSALPIRQAVALDRWGAGGLESPEALALLREEPKEYVIEAFGFPAIVFHRQVEQLKKELPAHATLLRKGHPPIRAASVEIPEYGQYLTVTFRFPRQAPIAAEDGSVEFIAATQQFDLRKKFKLPAMTYEGRLEL
ncbi:MAG: hypothetical protein KIT09_23480 [Bryobacteraceae bacterium]|nr:hypothetical protein [Bryobacteraceae bacterium]